MAMTDGAGADAWLGLAGKVCVITGAGRGIGAETSRQLASAGAAVALLDRDGDLAAEVAGEIVRAGGRAIGLPADVTQPDAVADAGRQIERTLGSCQVLVNNAGVADPAGPLMHADLRLWNRTLAVNLTGALVCVQHFAAQMVAAGQGGVVVNVASICGHAALPRAGAYSVSKSGLMMLTRMLSLELAEHRIRCNSVSPGLVRTPLTEAAYSDADLADRRRRMVPSDRIGDPVDLANVIVFLASDRAGYINGEDILVDGALSRGLMALLPRPAP